MFTETDLNRKNRKVQNLYRTLFMLMTIILIVPVAIILATLVYKGGGIISIDFLFTDPTNGMTEGGIFPALLGTVWIVGVALIASVPLGVAAAIYLNEYAPDNGFTRIIQLAIINLAGVPSIVHALFGVGAFVIFFGFGTSILAASLTLAVMTLPVVIVSTRESLRAVPHAFREACWNMGATRWQTIRRVVLPNAISGVLTGIILEVSRTAGETAPVMFTGAVFFTPFLPQSVFDQTMAMSLHLFVVATQVPGVPDDLLWCGLGAYRHGVDHEQCLHRLPHAPEGQKEMVSATQQSESVPVTESPTKATSKIEVRDLTISYGDTPALRGVSLKVREHEIFGIIGPANAGKTSFLKVLNRMNTFDSNMSIEGSVYFNGLDTSKLRNIYALRSRIGVVFPLPVGLPLTIYENVALSPRLRGINNKAELDVIVERCLARAALWDEVKDRLDSLGSLLSGGQQQRLTIARALSQEPEVLMLDEFSIAVDPVTTMRIEDVLKELKSEMTIILVTNLVQQARRLAGRIAFFLNGECVEIGDTEDLFDGKVQDQRTLDYIEGKFG